MAYDNQYAVALEPVVDADGVAIAPDAPADPWLGLDNMDGMPTEVQSVDASHTTLSTTGTTVVAGEGATVPVFENAGVSGTLSVASVSAAVGNVVANAVAGGSVPVYSEGYVIPAPEEMVAAEGIQAPVADPTIGHPENPQAHPDADKFEIIQQENGTYDSKSGQFFGDGTFSDVAVLKDPSILVNTETLTGSFDQMVNQLANTYSQVIVHDPLTGLPLYANRGLDETSGNELGFHPVNRADHDSLLRALTVHYADFPTLREYLVQQMIYSYDYNGPNGQAVSGDFATEMKKYTDLMKETVANPAKYFANELEAIAYQMGLKNRKDFTSPEIQSMIQPALRYMSQADVQYWVEKGFKSGAKKRAKKKAFFGLGADFGKFVSIALAFTGVGAAIGGAIAGATGITAAVGSSMIGNVAVSSLVNGVIGNTIVSAFINEGDIGAALRGGAIGGLGVVAGAYAGVLSNNSLMAFGSGFDTAASIASGIQTGVQVGFTTGLSGGNIGDALLHAGASAAGGYLANSAANLVGIDLSQTARSGIGNIVAQASLDGRVDFESAIRGFIPSGGVTLETGIDPTTSQPADSTSSSNFEVLVDDEGHVLPSAPPAFQEAYKTLISQGLNRTLSFQEIQFIRQFSSLNETGLASLDVDVATISASIAVYKVTLQDPEKDLIYTLNYRTDAVGKIEPNDTFTKAFEGMTATGLNTSQTFDLLVSIGPNAFNELTSLGVSPDEAITMMKTLEINNEIKPEGFPDSIANAVRPLQIRTADGQIRNSLTGTIFQSPTSEGTKYYLSFSAHGLDGGGGFKSDPSGLSGFLKGPNGEIAELGSDVLGSVILADGTRLEVPFDNVVSGLAVGQNGYSVGLGDGGDFVISEVPKEFAETFVNSKNPKDIPLLATGRPELGQTVYSNGAPAYAGDPAKGIYRMVASVGTVTDVSPTYFHVKKDDIAGNGLPGAGSSGQIMGWVNENGQAVIAGFNQGGIPGRQLNIAVPIVADPDSHLGFRTGNVIKR